MQKSLEKKIKIKKFQQQLFATIPKLKNINVKQKKYKKAVSEKQKIHLQLFIIPKS